MLTEHSNRKVKFLLLIVFVLFYTLLVATSSLLIYGLSFLGAGIELNSFLTALYFCMIVWIVYPIINFVMEVIIKMIQIKMGKKESKKIFTYITKGSEVVLLFLISIVVTFFLKDLQMTIFAQMILSFCFIACLETIFSLFKFQCKS